MRIKRPLSISIDPAMLADIEQVREHLARQGGERPSTSAVVRACLRLGLPTLTSGQPTTA